MLDTIFIIMGKLGDWKSPKITNMVLLSFIESKKIHYHVSGFIVLKDELVVNANPTPKIWLLRNGSATETPKNVTNA